MTETTAARLAAIRATPISVEECLAAVAAPSAGAAVVFTGVVRDHDAGRSVRLLEYSAHPSAPDVLGEVVRSVAAAHPGVLLAAVHRVGALTVGELAVVVAASSAHRAAAFDAARRLIDDVKARVPIWKRQRYDDGSDEWVGCDVAG